MSSSAMVEGILIVLMIILCVRGCEHASFVDEARKTRAEVTRVDDSGDPLCYVPEKNATEVCWRDKL